MITLDGEKLINEKELSTRYGLSMRWFQKNRYSENKIPFFKLNGHVFYNPKDVDGWLKENLKPNY
jgi:hypothetical protein